MSRTKSFEEATDSLLAGSANVEWRAVNSNTTTIIHGRIILWKKKHTRPWEAPALPT
jgi:hypothetical protein